LEKDVSGKQDPLIESQGSEQNPAINSNFFQSCHFPVQLLLCVQTLCSLFARVWRRICIAYLQHCFLLRHTGVIILMSFSVPGSPHTKYEKEYNY